MAPPLPLARAALFLDLDGTVVDIAPTPEAATASPACRRLLRDLASALDGRLAILTGRDLQTADRMIGGAVGCVAGVHGLERRAASGAVQREAPHPALGQAAEVLEALARAAPALRVERKGASVAVHYRQAPEAEAAILEAAQRLAAGTGLEVQLGKAVAELRTPGPCKAAALERFMQEAPFAGATPLVLGDDLTDEPAFLAASRLGGRAILVGAPRRSHADLRLPEPAHVLGWLGRALACGSFDLAAAAWSADTARATL